MTDEIKNSGDKSQAAPNISTPPPQSQQSQQNQQNQSSQDKSKPNTGSPSVSKDESKPAVSATPSSDSSKK